MQHTAGKNTLQHTEKKIIKITCSGGSPESISTSLASLPWQSCPSVSQGAAPSESPCLCCFCYSGIYSGFGHPEVLAKSQTQNPSKGYLGQHPTAIESISHWDSTWPLNSLYYISVLKSAIPVRRQKDC